MRVTPDVRRAVLERDGCCILLRLDPSHHCRDVWGEYHDPRDLDKLTIEHVKDEPMMGKRAPDDLAHLVALCGYANVAVPSKTLRAAMRAYLADLYIEDCSTRDAIRIAYLLERLRPDMEAHPEEYTLEALQRRMPLPEEDVARLRREHPEWPW